jgi:hypothetical protein
VGRDARQRTGRALHRTVTDVVPIPVEEGLGTAVVLGGAERRDLYVACGLEVMDWEKSRREGQGSIWTARVPVPAGACRP